MWRLGGLLALLAATTKAQEGVPRPTRLRIYEVRTALRFDEGELQRVNFRYDRSSGIKSDIARSLVDCGLTTDRGFVFEVAFFGTEEPGTVKARCQLGIPDVAEMNLSDADREDIALRVAKDVARAADDGRLRAALAAHNFNGLSSAFDPDATANYALRDTVSAPFPEETPKPSIARAPAPAPGGGGGGGGGSNDSLAVVYALVAIVVVLVVIGLAYYAYRRGTSRRPLAFASMVSDALASSSWYRVASTLSSWCRVASTPSKRELKENTAATRAGKKKARAEDEVGSLAAFSRRSLERELALEEGRRFSAPARLVKDDEDDDSPGLTPPELLRGGGVHGGSTSGGSRRSAPSQQLLRGFGGRPMDENWGRAGSVHSGSRRSAPLPARAPLARARTDPGYASAGSRRGPRRPPPAPVRQASPRRNPLQPPSPRARADPGYASGASRRDPRRGPEAADARPPSGYASAGSRRSGGPRRPENRRPAPARAASPLHEAGARAPPARAPSGAWERRTNNPPPAPPPTGAWGRRPNGEPAPGPHTPRGAVPPSRGFGGGELTPRIAAPPPRRQSRGFGGGTLPNLSAASRRQASGLDAAIVRGQAAAMGDVSDLTEDDGTSSPTILHQADAIRFLERARARR